jgi:C-terminal processing protease CtpA/Prc
MGGDFGMEFKQYGPEVPEEEQKLEIRRVRPGGAAAKAGVTVGDTIIAVDGQDVTGENQYLAWSLMHVAVGTKVAFGFASGVTHELVAEKPE